jgi:hypothetical protein
MRIRHRQHGAGRRFEDLLLNLRTARWLGRRLWRPTVLVLVERPLRMRR